MTLDLCIPAHNEEEIIVETLHAVRAALESIPGLVWTILVVSNASTDQTAQKARSLLDDRITVIDVSEGGKGNAICVAARQSTAHYFGFIDADLSADPSEIETLLLLVAGGNADIAIGSRLLDQTRVHRSFLRTLSSQIFNTLRYVLLGLAVADTQCGLKIMNAKVKELLCACEERGWFLDVELLARTQQQQLRIVEIAIAWDEYRYAQRVSKLRLVRDGIGAVRAFVRIRARTRTRHSV